MLAAAEAWVERLVASGTVYVRVVCGSVCSLKGKRLKLSTPAYMLHGHHSACVDPEVKQSQDTGHMVIRCTASMDLQVDMTAYRNIVDMIGFRSMDNGMCK